MKNYNDDIALPVLFNPWKHHLNFIKDEIAMSGIGDTSNLKRLRDGLLLMGDSVTDIYTGKLTPLRISRAIIKDLKRNGRLDRGDYIGWIKSAKNRYMITELPDGSRWTLRIGEDESRYVHLHPGRYSPHSLRVKALTLRSAAAVLAWTHLHGGSPYDVETVNRARKYFLNAEPVNSVSFNYGLGKMIKILEMN